MSHSKAFTLIELLVVIAIIGLLASIVLVSLQGAAATARDGKRDAEAGESSSALRKTLEVYHSANGSYPWNDDTEAELGCCLEGNSDIKGKLVEYLPKDLEDPRYDPSIAPDDLDQYCYRYKTTNSGEDYKIRVNYETGGYKEVASWGGGSIVYQEPEIVTFAKTLGYNNLPGNNVFSQQTSDDGHVVIKFGTMPGPNIGFYILKIDSSGDREWTKSYIGVDSYEEPFIQEIPTGGYIISGCTDASIFVMKLDSLGDKVWVKKYGSASNDCAYSLDVVDGGYVVTGHTEGFGEGQKDIFLLKLDSSGDYVWAKTYGSGNDETAYSVVALDSGYVVTGDTNNDILVIKLDSDGDLVWKKSFTAATGGRGYSVKETSDGSFVVIGKTGLNNDDIILKLDSSGTQVWAKTCGGDNNKEIHSIQYVSVDGGYIVAGGTKNEDPFALSPSLIMKLDPLGDKVWVKDFDRSNQGWFTSIHQSPDGGYSAFGFITSCPFCSAVGLTVKLDASGGISSCSYLKDITSDISLTPLGDIFSATADSILSADLADIYLSELDVTIEPEGLLASDLCPE